MNGWMGKILKIDVGTGAVETAATRERRDGSDGGRACEAMPSACSSCEAHAIAETLSWRTRSSRQNRTRAWFTTSRSSR